MTTSCPFCRIAAHELPAAGLSESRLALSFLDTRPIRPGHALVVSKRHEADFWSLSVDEQDEMMALARQLADAQRKLFEPKKVGLLLAGFDVAHAHLHVIPLHDTTDVASEAIRLGTLTTASPEQLAEMQGLYARHFGAQT